MAKFCEVCGKGVAHGNSVSHSHRKTKRTWAPNVQKARIIVGGTVKKVNICTRCMRSAKVERAI